MWAYPCGYALCGIILMKWLSCFGLLGMSCQSLDDLWFLYAIEPDQPCSVNSNQSGLIRTRWAFSFLLWWRHQSYILCEKREGWKEDCTMAGGQYGFSWLFFFWILSAFLSEENEMLTKGPILGGARSTEGSVPYFPDEGRDITQRESVTLTWWRSSVRVWLSLEPSLHSSLDWHERIGISIL